MEYFLLTPGPLTTSPGVRGAMNEDLSTWDSDYNDRVQSIRRQLVTLATGEPGFTSVLIQGCGTGCVEATVGSVVPEDGKLLVVANGAYGLRIAEIAEYLGINHRVLDFGEVGEMKPRQIDEALRSDPYISHVVVVHCETTTGRLNPLADIAAVVKNNSCCLIVDAMSSFGGIPMDAAELGIDYLISSANKCIQGVPGFGFVIARQQALEDSKGCARSLTFDLYTQWQCMENHGGKWRFTSPAHTVLAFEQALKELAEEGGVAARYQRYCENHRVLVSGMESLGFECLLPAEEQSPIITSFYTPDHPGFEFKRFYDALKSRGFVIYPGKVSRAPCFRIGTIGHVFPENFHQLVREVQSCMYWLEPHPEKPMKATNTNNKGLSP
ncbi:2-aminoethylphosphonate--pyruvate transaminase [Sansalvadorimonas verongulae]|uniref:2-aminoethylphosphonate--pyruvate transaminase n=1 Tax=Sansalvadorimonas verongulae TaxID=2172824 RepID=UPI002E35D36B|nr:2-aminoethylphosphonate--pyruvate transaminase [Sansalvadorimonas verongulae]MTI13701.1 2-aminoethylphosphonate--pyruvate transaminase [Sansalvadorimonas verongulae]